MLALTDIRNWIASLELAGDDNVYIGKLDNKKQKSIGVYGRSSSGPPTVALGGLACTSYAIRPISLLIHWSRNKEESEKAAYELYERLQTASDLTMGETPVNYLRLMVPEPQDVGTDDGGIYEYVIWMDLFYERK